jgi:predicted alpha/beta hydrolase family esterase
MLQPSPIPSPPPLRHFLGEAHILGDWIKGRFAERRIAATYPGDGRNVMVLPGFLTTDNRTRMLRRVLSRAGYRTHGWGLGRNMPVKADLFERLDREMDRIQAGDSGTVTLIGWSLGGIIAREYAKHAPDRVSAVITLGSPFSGDPHSNRAWRVYELFADHPVDQPPIPVNFSVKPPVPTIAIWSASDGIIPPDAARGQSHESDRQIEIDCGHFAMTCAPSALEAVLSVLISKYPFLPSEVEGLVRA